MKHDEEHSAGLERGSNFKASSIQNTSPSSSLSSPKISLLSGTVTNDEIPTPLFIISIEQSMMNQFKIINYTGLIIPFTKLKQLKHVHNSVADMAVTFELQKYFDEIHGASITK